MENGLGIQFLKQCLEYAGIDLDTWGTGEAKTLHHLQKEIESAETALVTGAQGQLLRKVTVCAANVYHVSLEGKKYRLKEEKQIFKDGRERRRGLEQAVSEKMKPDEDPRNAMIRGMKEELGIQGEIFLEETAVEEQLLSSPSYPGLQSQYVRYIFRAILTGHQFKPGGYIEEQKDKSTYFVWEEV